MTTGDLTVETILHNASAAEPVPTVFQPDAAPDVYAASGVGDCMVPLIPGNATLAFDKRQSVGPGDVVHLWFTPEHARRLGIAGWVKRLRSPLPPAGHIGLIEVEMLNPYRVLTLRSTEVMAVHKCIGIARSTGSGLAAITSRIDSSEPAVLELCEPSVTERSNVCGVQIVSDLPPEPIKLKIFAKPPACTIVHAATDNSNAPLIREGEIVVVDHNGKAGWLPRDGGLFLIEYLSPAPSPHYDYERRCREIVQTFRDHKGRWWAGGLRRGVVGNNFYCCDGPYRDEMHLAGKLLGPVIGIVDQPSIDRNWS